MTGVEKVRQLAARLVWVRRLYRKTGTGDDAMDGPIRSHIHRLCLAYGAYLRGMIEVWREWYDSENCGGYDRDNSRAVCRQAIAAWQEVIHGKELT